MTGSMCLVEIDGSEMPADLVPLLVSALVEDSQRLPDMFSLRFRDPERIVLSKSNAKVGGKITIKVNTAASSSPSSAIASVPTSGSSPISVSRRIPSCSSESPSFRKIALMCFSTDRSVTVSSRAMAAFPLPEAISVMTSSSRGVSPASRDALRRR